MSVAVRIAPITERVTPRNARTSIEIHARGAVVAVEDLESRIDRLRRGGQREKSGERRCRDAARNGDERVSRRRAGWKSDQGCSHAFTDVGQFSVATASEEFEAGTRRGRFFADRIAQARAASRFELCAAITSIAPARSITLASDSATPGALLPRSPETDLRFQGSGSLCRLRAVSMGFTTRPRSKTQVTEFKSESWLARRLLLRNGFTGFRGRQT